MIVISEHGPIAVVDDDDMDRMIIKRVLGLSKLQNSVAEFDSATSFIAHLDLPESEREPIALVLMDINMPVMTGLEALEHIRKSARLDALPIVVMLTSSEAKTDIEMATRLGADGYLVKQSGIELFVATIDDSIRNESTA